MSTWGFVRPAKEALELQKPVAKKSLVAVPEKKKAA
jgi:hypothetical protein